MVMGQQIAPEVACCRSEKGGRGCEISLFDLSDHPNAPNSAHSLVQIHGCTAEPPDFVQQMDPDEWGCSSCRADDTDIVGLSSMDALSYVPVRFDVTSTVDADRSQARYSKIVVHSTRARTQRRSKAWEEWLRAATAGREITLLVGEGFQTTRIDITKEALLNGCQKINAKYCLDRGLTKLTIMPVDPGANCKPVAILVDNIQVVCPLTDFMLLSDVVEAQLDESERSRAALVQYLAESGESQRVCFLEESENAKDRCVQALTALWLEKRNDHSMWF